MKTHRNASLEPSNSRTYRGRAVKRYWWRRRRSREGGFGQFWFIFFETRERKFSNRHTEELLLGNPKRKRESRKVFGKKKESVPSTRIERRAEKEGERKRERTWTFNSSVTILDSRIFATAPGVTATADIFSFFKKKRLQECGSVLLSLFLFLNFFREKP